MAGGGVGIDDSWLKSKLTRERKPRPRTITEGAMERARRESAEMMRSGDWSEAMGRHFLALYLVLHARVYGVEAGLTEDEYFEGATAAAKLLEGEFDEDPGALVRFVAWTWEREREREEWRRKNGKGGGSVGWRLQFSGRLLTDYRLALRRRGGT